jgi:hypothetical protein
MSHAEIQKPTDVTIPAGSLFTKMPLIGGVVAVAGLGAVIAVSMGDSEGASRAMFSYLWAFELFLGLALASLGFLLIDQVARAGWSVVVRRIGETMAATLPVFALLIIPIFTVGYHKLYPWTHEHDAILEHKRWFLSDGFFYGRAVFYFAVWIFLSRALYSASIKQDNTTDVGVREKTARRVWILAAPGIILYALTQSFAAIDWMMSLQPHWYSTIFGVYFFAATIQAYWAFKALITMAIQKSGAIKDAVTTEHFHDLGKYTFGFTIFWAYIAFSQFILIWYANIPEETTFYITRLQGGWNYVSYALPVAHFFLPFFYLLSRKIKRNRTLLAIGASYTLFMYAVDFYWLILPNFGTHGEARHEAVLALSWTDFAALLGMTGAFLGAFSFFLTRHKVICINDPRLEESLAHENF